jgi:hypothetical protein
MLSHVTLVAVGSDAAYRQLISNRIAERSSLLWERKGSVPEWEQFLEEVVHKKAVTNLHANRPTAPIPPPVGRPF